MNRTERGSVLVPAIAFTVILSLMIAAVGRSVVGHYKKCDVDASYASLAGRLLAAAATGVSGRVVFGTHDRRLIDVITDQATRGKLAKGACEFHLLYGIQRAEQARLVREGWPLR